MCGGGGGNTLVLWLTLLAFAAVAILVASFPQPAQAQSDDDTSGRIVARLLDDGRVEFGWQPAGGERVLPRQRYFPTNARVDRWLRSSPVEVDGVEIGRINARLLANGRIEFGFTPTDGERILTRARYFPTNAQVGRWLRSTEITISAPAVPGFIAISAGDRHTCGLRSTGKIACWGWNDNGQTDAPEGSFAAISGGHAHTCGLRASGEIVCWGWNDDGQTDVPTGSFTAVSAGDNHTCALSENGAIACWGASVHDFGQTDAPEGNFRTISAGAEHNCAIRDTGALTCWGNNDDGQSDAPEGSFAAVSAGRYHTCAINESGAITCWGLNGYYITDTETGGTKVQETGQTDAPDGTFSAISARTAHTCSLRENGAIECWGDNYIGQTNVPEGTFAAVSAGWHHTCGLRENGAIECWGWNGDGQTDVPIWPDDPARFTAVSAGSAHACAIRDAGEIACWGNNTRTNWYDPETEEGSYTETGQADPPEGRFTAVSAGELHTCAIRETGEIACWGDNEVIAGWDDNDRPVWDYGGQSTPPMGDFTAVSAGGTHTCAIRGTEEITCWGDNRRGQTDAPEGRFLAVSAESDYTCAIRRSNGGIECWGLAVAPPSTPPTGSFTEISIGITTRLTFPGQTDSGNDTTYGPHACGLRTSGEIECWGDATYSPHAAPLGTFASVSAGAAHACGLRESGAIECWGDNRFGETDAPEGTFTALSAHWSYTCAIREGGEIECWGDNGYGQATPPAR